MDGELDTHLDGRQGRDYLSIYLSIYLSRRRWSSSCRYTNNLSIYLSDGGPISPILGVRIPPFLIRSTIQVRFDDSFVIWCDTDLIRNGAAIDLIGIGVHDIDVILM